MSVPLDPTGTVERAPLVCDGRGSGSPQVAYYSLSTTWASTCDIWSWGLNSTILTASSTTMV